MKRESMRFKDMGTVWFPSPLPPLTATYWSAVYLVWFRFRRLMLVSCIGENFTILTSDHVLVSNQTRLRQQIPFEILHRLSDQIWASDPKVSLVKASLVKDMKPVLDGSAGALHALHFEFWSLQCAEFSISSMRSSGGELYSGEWLQWWKEMVSLLILWLIQCMYIVYKCVLHRVLVHWGCCMLYNVHVFGHHFQCTMYMDICGCVLEAHPECVNQCVCVCVCVCVLECDTCSYGEVYVCVWNTHTYLHL